MAKKYPKLSTILKRLLFERGLRPTDLAKAVKLPPPTVHRLVTGKSTRPYQSSLEPIANYFSISVEQLLGEAPINEHDSNLSTGNNEVKKIPIITWNELDNPEAAKKASKNEIVTIGSTSKTCFALIMNDYSMEPLFPKNSILVFDQTKQPTDRSYVLLKRHNKDIPIFRQLLVDAEHRYIKPLNPDFNLYKLKLLHQNDRILASLIESRINHSSNNELTS